MCYVSALFTCVSPSSRGLGHRVFIPKTRVRFPLGTPYEFLNCCASFNSMMAFSAPMKPCAIDSILSILSLAFYGFVR